CGGGYSGPEVVYTLKQAERTSYRFTVTGSGSYDPDLIVLQQDANGHCDPERCLARAAQAGPSDSLSFVGEARTEATLAVDSKGAGGAYQLGVECLPSCRTDLQLSCASNWINAKTNGNGSTDRVDAWGGCATGLTGNETVYMLSASTAGSYHVSLRSG